MRSNFLCCLIINILLFSQSVLADLPPCTQIEALFGDLPGENAFLGNSVATTQLSDNRVLIVAGAPQYNNGTGAAFVYIRDNFGDSTTAKSYPTVLLHNPKVTTNGQFGTVVAITKNTIIVGHPSQSAIYTYSTQDFAIQQQLVYSGQFGTDIAVYGDTLMAVGAPADNAAYIFEYSSGSWKYQAMVTDEEAPLDASFGLSVALDDQVLAVGADGNNTAYVFEKNGSEWNLVTKLRPTGEISANVLVFGFSVAVIPETHTVIVGDYLEPSAQTADKKDAGVLYFFERNQVNNTVTYTQVQRMIEVNSSRFDHFGESIVVIDQNTILTNAHKRAVEFTDEGVAYTLVNTNGTWVQSTTIRAQDPSNYAWFGWGLAVYKNTWEYILVVGSRTDTTKIYNGGAVRLFSCPFGSPPRQEVSDDGDNNRDVNIAVGVVVAVIGLTAVFVAGYFIYKRTNKGYTKSDI